MQWHSWGNSLQNTNNNIITHWLTQLGNLFRIFFSFSDHKILVFLHHSCHFTWLFNVKNVLIIQFQTFSEACGISTKSNKRYSDILVTTHDQKNKTLTNLSGLQNVSITVLKHTYFKWWQHCQMSFSFSDVQENPNFRCHNTRVADIIECRTRLQSSRRAETIALRSAWNESEYEQFIFRKTVRNANRIWRGWDVCRVQNHSANLYSVPKGKLFGAWRRKEIMKLNKNELICDCASAVFLLNKTTKHKRLSSTKRNVFFSADRCYTDAN